MVKFTNDELKNSMDKYSADYSESGFLDFVKKYGKKAGKLSIFIWRYLGK